MIARWCGLVFIVVIEFGVVLRVTPVLGTTGKLALALTSVFVMLLTALLGVIADSAELGHERLTKKE